MLSVANLLVVWFSTPKPRQLNIFREIGELMMDLRGPSSTYWRWGGWIWTEVTQEFLVLGWDGVCGHTGIACGRIQWRLKSTNQWRREHSAVEVESHFDLHSISSWSASDLSLNWYLMLLRRTGLVQPHYSKLLTYYRITSPDHFHNMLWSCSWKPETQLLPFHT